jgi:hypothetical protein
MNRKDFFEKIAGCGFCASAGAALSRRALAAENAEEGASAAERAKAKIASWITDLITSAKTGEERAQLIKMLESCGRKCFHQHEPPAAPETRGNLEACILNFQKILGAENVKREGNVVHFRYPMSSCVCPVANSVPVQPDDLFCNCSRGWVQAAFDAALGGIPRVKCLESFRRGGKACRFDIEV